MEFIIFGHCFVFSIVEENCKILVGAPIAFQITQKMPKMRIIKFEIKRGGGGD